jgi:hypothetical protein
MVDAMIRHMQREADGIAKANAKTEAAMARMRR